MVYLNLQIPDFKSQVKMYSSLLVYTLKSALVLTLLFLPYLPLLRRERFFRLSRMTLLSVLLLSLLLPLCRVSLPHGLTQMPVVDRKSTRLNSSH